jgi:hypothetical protein
VASDPLWPDTFHGSMAVAPEAAVRSAIEIGDLAHGLTKHALYQSSRAKIPHFAAACQISLPYEALLSDALVHTPSSFIEAPDCNEAADCSPDTDGRFDPLRLRDDRFSCFVKICRSEDPEFHSAAAQCLARSSASPSVSPIKPKRSALETWRHQRYHWPGPKFRHMS